MADKALTVAAKTAQAGAKSVIPKKPEVVLDEDEWTEKVEAIIKRDYFPEIPKAQSKLEWLQAVRSGDPERMRQAQLNIAQRRAGLRTPMPGAQDTPWLTARPATHAADLATPYIHLGQTPTVGATPAMRTGGPAGPPTGDPAGPQVPVQRLDQFMAKHTSEDNASFQELLEKDNKRKRAKVEALQREADATLGVGGSKIPRLEGPGGPFGAAPLRIEGPPGPPSGPGPGSNKVSVVAIGEQQKQSSVANAAQQQQQTQQQPDSAMDGTESGAGAIVAVSDDSKAIAGVPLGAPEGPPGEPFVKSWPYVVKNRLFYNMNHAGTELQLSTEELAARVAGPPRAIKSNNTRFPSAAAEPESTSTAPSQQVLAPGSRLPDGRLAPEAQHGNPNRPYGYLDTPSITKPDESPLMTWGEIGGTPLRLGGGLGSAGVSGEILGDLEGDEGLVYPSEGGRTFKLPEVRKREQLALHLSGKAASSLQKKGSAVPLLNRRPTTGRPGSGKLSDAALRLASSMRGGTTPAAGSADAQLRASYKAGGVTPGGGRTPISITAWERGNTSVRGNGSTMGIGSVRGNGNSRGKSSLGKRPAGPSATNNSSVHVTDDLLQ